MQFNLNCKTVIEADSLKYIINDLLQQYDNNDVLQFYAFFFKKNLLIECNYEIYDKKLLIIVFCLREWDLKLCSVKKFKVIINYKNLIYFIMIWKLNEKQVCWIEELSKFNFIINYWLKKEETQSNMLLRWE